MTEDEFAAVMDEPCAHGVTDGFCRSCCSASYALYFGGCPLREVVDAFFNPDVTAVGYWALYLECGHDVARWRRPKHRARCGECL